MLRKVTILTMKILRYTTLIDAVVIDKITQFMKDSDFEDNLDSSK